MKPHIRRISYAPIGWTTLGALLAAGTPSRGAEFIVTNTNDAGAGSLRQAIIDANSTGGPDDILFAQTLSGTITLTSSQLDITSELMIHGRGANVLAVSGNNARRVFFISGGPVTIEDLTVRNGRVDATPGGGAIHVNGTTLTLRRCAVRDSVSNNSAGAANGGGISTLNMANLVLDSCEFSGNTVSASTQAFGGAIRAISGTFEATNCTFSGNTAAGDSQSFGGALNVSGPQPQMMTHCTITDNDVTSGIGNGAGHYLPGSGMFHLRSVLNAGNFGATDFGRSTGTFVSECFNLDGDGGSGLPSGGCDLIGTTESPIDPLLGALGDNGGPTRTHDLLTGSPALDAGGDGAGLASDQRGFPRVSDADCAGDVAADIGAYELQMQLPFELADSNCDGGVNFFDIDPFVLALFNLAAYQGLYCTGAVCTVDTDCSGQVNFFDIDPFITCLFEVCAPCP